MKRLPKSIMDRISKLEEKQDELGDPIQLYYTDGRIVETTETFPIRVEEVGACFDWSRYVDGIINEPPALKKTVNLKTGEVWDFEESARKPPMTEEEIDALVKKIESDLRECGAI